MDYPRPHRRCRRARDRVGQDAVATRRRRGYRLPRGGGTQCGAPCRGRRASCWRAIWVTRPRRGSNGDRGRAHRDTDDRRRRSGRNARARHRIRGRDHHIQRHRGSLDRRGNSARIGRLVQRRGNGRGVGDRRNVIDALPRRSELHDKQSRSGVLTSAARVRRRDCPRALRTVRRAPDRPAPRLLPAGLTRRRRHR